MFAQLVEFPHEHVQNLYRKISTQRRQKYQIGHCRWSAMISVQLC